MQMLSTENSVFFLTAMFQTTLIMQMLITEISVFFLAAMFQTIVITETSRGIFSYLFIQG